MKTLIAALTVLAVLPCAAQEAKKEDPVEAVIVALKGVVDVKRPGDADWVEAKKDMKLAKGSEMCTSVGASATLLFTGGIKVDVKSLTQARIEQLVKADNKINADVKLKFGSVDVDIQKGDLKTDLKIATPNSTTSVSGSSGTVHAWASGGHRDVSMRAYTGNWHHHLTMQDRTVDLTNGECTNPLGQTIVDMFHQETFQTFSDFGQTSGDFGFVPLIQHFDHQFGFLQPYEYGSERFNPAGGAFLQSGTLPLPPPPPPQP